MNHYDRNHTITRLAAFFAVSATLLLGSMQRSANGALTCSKTCRVSRAIYRPCRGGLLRRFVLQHRCRCSSSAEAQAPVWQPLFDGKTFAGWKETVFGGEGEVSVEDGVVTLDTGVELTGITYQRDFPKTNYEIRLDAMRVEGIDFFCGLTFPVDDSHCSFIVGGWAGAVVGLSSIDGKDASENDTTRYLKFKTGQWYAIRLRVTPDRIACWIDDKQVVDRKIRGHKITTRGEVDLSKPLGFSAWQTKAALRKIEYRLLNAGEK